MADLRKQSERKLPRVTGSGLKLAGLMLMILVSFGRIYLERGVIGLDGYTLDQLPALMDARPELTPAIGLAGVLRLLKGLAVPIYALLTVEGFLRTSDLGAYLGRTALTAALSEVIFDYAVVGRVWDFTQQNPMFGVVLSLVMLTLLRLTDGQPRVEKAIYRILIVLFAVFWAILLRTESGVEMVLLCAVMYLFRERPILRTSLGVLISVMDPIGPFAFCALVLYNGTRSEKCPRGMYYVAYPLHLLILALITSRII